MSKYFVDYDNNGEVTTKTTYTCETKGVSYNLMSEDIKSYFNFLGEYNGSGISRQLDLVVEYLAKIVDVKAFHFENAGTKDNLNLVYEKIKAQVDTLKLQLGELNSSFHQKVDAVNDEIEANFGHLVCCKPKRVRQETIQNDTN